MPNGDPRDGFFYPTLKLMIDSYSLGKPRDAKRRSSRRIFLSYPHTRENPSLGITICHDSASLVMPNGDPRDGFFYPTLKLMIDSYSLGKPRDAKRRSSRRIFLSYPHTRDRSL